MYTYIAVEINSTSSNQDPAPAYRRTPRRHWICPTAYPTRWAIVFCVWGNRMIWTYLTSSCNLVHLKRHPYQHRKQQMLCRAPNRRPQVACMLVRGECPEYPSENPEIQYDRCLSIHRCRRRKQKVSRPFDHIEIQAADVQADL